MENQTTETANHSESSNASMTTGTETTTANHSESAESNANETSNKTLSQQIDEDWGIKDEKENLRDVQDEENRNEENAEEEKISESDEGDGESGENQEDKKAPEEGEQENKGTSLRVNYLGNTYDLPEDEARKYAVIGMNAGRIQDQYGKLKQLEPLKDTLEVLALFEDKSVDDVIKDFGNMSMLRKNEVNALVEQGHDVGIAEELFDSRWREMKQKQELQSKQKQNEKGLTAYQKEQVERFSKFRPEEHQNVCNGKPLPKDVLSEWASGTDLVTAWLMHENNEFSQQVKDSLKQVNDMKKQLTELKKNAKNAEIKANNKEKAPTRKKGTGGGAGSTDIYAGWDKY